MRQQQGQLFRVQPHLAPAPAPIPTPDPSLASRESKPARRCRIWMQGLDRGLGYRQTHQRDMNSPPLCDAKAGRLAVCVSVCPEGGGYTCSLLAAEEKGGSHRILTRGRANQDCSFNPVRERAACLFPFLLEISVSRSVCLTIRIQCQENGEIKSRESDSKTKAQTQARQSFCWIGAQNRRHPEAGKLVGPHHPARPLLIGFCQEQPPPAPATAHSQVLKPTSTSHPYPP